jgi:hypothetical protein
MILAPLAQIVHCTPFYPCTVGGASVNMPMILKFGITSRAFAVVLPFPALQPLPYATHPGYMFSYPSTEAQRFFVASFCKKGFPVNSSRSRVSQSFVVSPVIHHSVFDENSISPLLVKIGVFLVTLPDRQAFLA